MDTLRGVFPEPKVPPKRNFIKENVKKLQDLQKLNNIQKNNAIAESKKRLHNIPGSKSRCSSSSTSTTALSTNNNNKPLKAQNQIDEKQQQQQQQHFKINSNRNKIDQLLLSTNVKSKSAKTPIITTQNDNDENVINNVIKIVEDSGIAPIIKQLKDASSQTGDINDEEFLKDTIIIYPSASVLEKLKQSNYNNKESISAGAGAGAGGAGDGDGNYLSPDSQMNINIMPLSATTSSLQSNNFLKLGNLGEDVFVTSSEADDIYNLNRQQNDYNYINHTNTKDNVPKTYDNSQQTSAAQMTQNKNNIPKSYRYGELPKYLKTMKEKNQLESQRIASIDPNCPYGHIPLSTAERLETLEIAKQKIQQLIEELNRMSLTSKSIKIKQRKTEIERELNHLEDNIKIFSKSKVYVRID